MTVPDYKVPPTWERRLRDDDAVDYFVEIDSWNPRKRIHLPASRSTRDDPEPACPCVPRNGGAWTDVDLATYPVGWVRICLRCFFRWLGLEGVP